MIRCLYTLSFAFFAFSAQATPRVGDYARFDTTTMRQWRVTSGTIELEILQEDGAGKFLERRTVTVRGHDPQVQEDWKPMANFQTDENIEKALRDCASLHGTREMIQVVAGRFDSCALALNNDSVQGTIWVAKVPLGVVRTESTSKIDGTQMTMELRESHSK